MNFPRLQNSPSPLGENIETQEVEKAGKFCANYHAVLDQTKYFDSDAISKADALLKQAEAIKTDRLPFSVQLVIHHRISYLRFISSFGSNPAIGAFLDAVKSEIGNPARELQNPEQLYRDASQMPEFERLNMEDFQKIKNSAQYGANALSTLNEVNSDWSKDAETLLLPHGDKRIDDKEAAGRLLIGFEKLEKFALIAIREKIRKG